RRAARTRFAAVDGSDAGRRARWDTRHWQTGCDERGAACRRHSIQLTSGAPSEAPCLSRRAGRESPTGTPAVSRSSPLGFGGQAHVIVPGAALGVLGGGQLGRMFAIAARRMGYRVHSFSPEDDSPAGQIADVEINASYEALEALRTFAHGVDVVTFEFENVPIDAIDAVEEFVPVRPSAVC